MKLAIVTAVVLFAMPAFAAPCAPVRGSEAILKPGAHLIFGEMHGTNETQRLVGDVACRAAAIGPVRVGLEIPGEEQPRLDAFLASSGGAADKKALLLGAFWTHDFQDGRSSTAMLALLESLQKLVHAGRDVKIVAFDQDGQDGKDGPDARDRGMAGRLAAAFTREPQAIFVVLVGNLHARKAAHPQFKRRFMAQFLVEQKQPVTTLDVRYGVGSAWICSQACGPQAIGHDAPAPIGITLSATADHAYDGTFSIGTPTFAPPAARPLTKAQEQRLALLGLDVEAARVCAANQFARCAELQIEHARQDPSTAADHLYDAACCYARLGDAPRAFTQLGAAVDQGFKDRAWLEKDTDLVSLHGDARWAKLLERLPATAKAVPPAK